MNQKMRAEHGCRVCGQQLQRCERAHVVRRVHDAGLVDPRDIVPLCSPATPNNCHARYDARQLDLAPYLTREEKERAIELVGHYEAARRIRSSRQPEKLLDDFPW